MQQELKLKDVDSFDLTIEGQKILHFDISNEYIIQFMEKEEHVEEVFAGLSQPYENELKTLNEKLSKGWDLQAMKALNVIEKTLAEAFYDYLFGAGTFEAMYSKIPNADFWFENVQEVLLAVASGITQAKKNRENRLMGLRNKLLHQQKNG